MKDLIEKLKDKTYVRAFGLMSPEEQEVLEKVGISNRLVLCHSGWDGDLFPIRGKQRIHYTYAIKPDYQPEPEFVDLEIVRHAEGTVEQTWWLGVWADKRAEIPNAFTHIHCLPSLPNFEGFWHDYDKKMGRRYFCNITEAAPKISEGHKVYARFRGQGQ